MKALDTKEFDWKHSLQLIAMRMKFEPFFYWLYVKRKQRRKKY